MSACGSKILASGIEANGSDLSDLAKESYKFKIYSSQQKKTRKKKNK